MNLNEALSRMHHIKETTTDNRLPVDVQRLNWFAWRVLTNVVNQYKQDIIDEESPLLQLSFHDEAFDQTIDHCDLLSAVFDGIDQFILSDDDAFKDATDFTN